jgi:microtubule-associated protein-like 6
VWALFVVATTVNVFLMVCSFSFFVFIAFTSSFQCSVYDKIEKTQRFHADHSDEVTCIALHPNGRIVATGERGRVPKVLVWDLATCQTICTLRGFHERGISQICFSTSGNELITVGMDEYNTIALYDWSSGNQKMSSLGDGPKKTSLQEQLECKLITAQRSGRELMLALESPPLMDENDAFMTTKQNKKQFVTCGEGGAIKFWDYQNQQLQYKHGVYGKIGPTSTMMSLGFRPDGNAVTGSADGRLYIWEGRTLTRLIHATPSSAILSIYSTAAMSYGGGSSSGSKKGGGIITGSSDGRVRMWDSSDNMRPGALYSTGRCLVVAWLWHGCGMVWFD